MADNNANADAAAAAAAAALADTHLGDAPAAQGAAQAAALAAGNAAAQIPGAVPPLPVHPLEDGGEDSDSDSDVDFARHAPKPDKYAGDSDAEVKSAFKAAWLGNIQTFAELKGISRNRLVAFTTMYLKGKALEAYHRKKSERDGTHLSPEEFGQWFMDPVSFGGVPETPYHITEQLLRFRLLPFCAKNGKNLSEGIQAFSDLHAKRPTPMDGVTLCYTFNKALPPELAERAKVANTREYEVFDLFKDRVMQFAADFEALLRADKAKQNSGPSTSKGRRQSSFSAKPPPAKRSKPSGNSDGRNPAQTPLANRSKDGGPNKGLFIRGLDATTKKHRQEQGHCLLCDSSKHYFKNCPQKDDKYSQGDWFYYPK